MQPNYILPFMIDKDFPVDFEENRLITTNYYSITTNEYTY